MPKPLVIGIAGGSGAGKSSLAESLVEMIGKNVSVLHTDDYFISPEDMPIYAGFTNWDTPKSVNFVALAMDIKTAIKEGLHEVIIVEGFLLFYYADLRKLLDIRIFLRAPHEVINERRVHDAPEGYRELVMKPMYEKYVLPSAKYATQVIDVASANKGEVLVSVMSFLHPHMLKRDMRPRNILITGIAGSGKSTVCEELAAMGYRVIEFDGSPSKNIIHRDYRKKFDRRTGRPALYERGSGWESLQHIDWKIDRDLLLSDLHNSSGDMQFFSGYANNWSDFANDFDLIILLETEPDVIKRRLLSRTTGDWGRRHPEEMRHALETVEDFNESVKKLGAITIAANQSVREVVTQILTATGQK
jgi:uridine kinase